MDNDMKIFMENITYLRKVNKLPKKKMAQILNIGIGSLTKLEKGEMPKRLGVDVVFKIVDYFKILPKDQFKKLEYKK